MTVRLSAAIMAHPRRAGMVEGLLAALDWPVPVVWDERDDRHDTGIRAMEAHGPDATHHLVIQDDVQPSRDLLAGVQRALAHVPDGCPASFYVGRVKPFRRAVERVTRSAEGASWIVMDGIYWGPAIAVPTNVIPDMARWWRGPLAANVTNYDRRVSEFFAHHGQARCWYSWPSLVDHRGNESLVQGHIAERRAHRFHDGSALDIDWAGDVVDMHRTAALDERRQQLAEVVAHA